MRLGGSMTDEETEAAHKSERLRTEVLEALNVGYEVGRKHRQNEIERLRHELERFAVFVDGEWMAR